MAAGWFFLSVCEAPPPINGVSLRVPGLGSYIQAATDTGNTRAKIFGMIAMGIVIVVVDRLIWWPLVVWSRKFKLDDFAGSRAPKNTLQLWLARSMTLQAIATGWTALTTKFVGPAIPPSEATSLLEPGSEPPRKSPVGRFHLPALLFVRSLACWPGEPSTSSFS